MITINGIDYVNGTRIPIKDIQDIIKQWDFDLSTKLDDEGCDWMQDHPVEERIQDYMEEKGIVMNETAIENLVEEVRGLGQLGSTSESNGSNQSFLKT